MSNLNESLNELTSDYESFDEYKKAIRQHQTFFVYSQVNSSAIPNICKNGAEGAKEFFNVMIYGRGIYTVLSYNNCVKYNQGDAMVKYAVKRGAFDNFLIFDSGVRQEMYKFNALTKHERISQTIRRLFSDEDFAMLENYYGKNLYNLDRAVESSNHSGNSNWEEERFLGIIRSNEGNIELYPGKRHPSEKRLDISNVDGFAYYGGYGSTAIFRTTDLLIPYAYAIRQRGSYTWPEENNFNFCIKDAETFNNINVSIDAFRRARKDYPDTRFTEKTVCGFSLVKNKNKYNLLSARSGKYFSPLDFDYCEAFDPLTQTAAFAINAEEDGVIEFMIHSTDRGKQVELYYRQKENEEGDTGWHAIPYKTFIEVMKSYKSEMLKESVDEVFTHKDFPTFKKWLGGNNVILYAATSPETAKNIFNNGPNMEFSGTSGDASLYYGLGVYTVRNKESLLCSKYGKGVVKFVLKDGYKNFLIFDKSIRDKWAPGKTVLDQLKELVPQNILQDFDKFLKAGLPHSPSLNNWQIQQQLVRQGIEGYRDTDISQQRGKTGGIEYNTASFVRALKLATQGRNLHDPLANAIYDELLMAKTKIRGFVFTGGLDGNVVLVRDFSSLMPIDYSVDCGKTWVGDFNEDTFNKINQRVDPFYQYRGEYETTGLRTKSISGFSLVSGKQGYNYKDIWFHRPLLPVDADKAFPFNPSSNSAQFVLCGVTFEVVVDKDLNTWLMYEDDGMMQESSYDELMQFIEEAKKQGLISGKKFYENNLLNPNNKRNK